MSLMVSIVSSGTVILQRAINTFGTNIISGHLAARKIFCITNIPILTLGTAAATFVSQNHGAGNKDRIKKGILISWAIITVWSLIMIFVSRIFLRQVLEFLTGSTDPKMIGYGLRYLHFSYPFLHRHGNSGCLKKFTSVTWKQNSPHIQFH